MNFNEIIKNVIANVIKNVNDDVIVVNFDIIENVKLTLKSFCVLCSTKNFCIIIVDDFDIVVNNCLTNVNFYIENKRLLHENIITNATIKICCLIKKINSKMKNCCN